MLERMKQQPIPEPTEELNARSNADNQFSNFDRAFRAVMSVPKAEILKREARDLHRNALRRAKKTKSKQIT